MRALAVLRTVSLFALLLLVACGPDPSASDPDGGRADAGFSDAGPSDAGPSDAGPSDAGDVDAGLADAGSEDGGRDAGPADGGACPVPCGELCCDESQQCEGGACVDPCEPACEGRACGPDGCGGSCGTCPEGECVDGACETCTPRSCQDQGKDCGQVSDGCGGTLSCGDCYGVKTCGGGGEPNVCGCTPHTCAELGKNCGSVSDGCGGLLSCGGCTAPETCGGGGEANVCGTDPCEPEPDATLCGRLGFDCGQVTARDNCDTLRTVDCGGCTSPESCGVYAANVCAHDCRLGGCTGLTWCEDANGRCLPGCEFDDQCGTNEVCQVASHACVCAPGFHLCGNTCVSDDSVDHCGGRCAACPTDVNGTAACDGRACSLTCDPGFILCAGGCVACEDPNGTPTCDAGGNCLIQCDPGFHLCGGACVSDSDPATCGTACTPCPAPTADGTATCEAGACGISCLPGYHACGTDCLSDTSPDSCGTSCTPCESANGTAGCVGGACTLTCDAGYRLCGGLCAGSADWFRPEYAGGTYREPSALQLVDLNLDGILDRVMGVVTNYDAYLRMDLGTGVVSTNGNGVGFVNFVNAFVSGFAEIKATAVADFDNNGYPDVVAIADHRGKIATQDGTAWIGGQDIALPNDQTMVDVAAGDVDGDGNADVVLLYEVDAGALGSTLTAELRFYKGNGDGTFAVPTITTTMKNTPRALVLADLDGDGLLDVGLVASGLHRMSGAGDGTFGYPQQLHWPARNALAQDVTGDGLVDLVVNDGYDLVVLQRTGPSAFTTRATLSSLLSWGGLLAAGDLDGDGRTDIARAYPASGTATDFVEVWYADGAGGYRGPVSWTVSDVTGFALGDLDGNGALDFATTGNSATGYGKMFMRLNACP